MKSVKGGVFLKNLLDKLETSYRFYIISASSITSLATVSSSLKEETP